MTSPTATTPVAPTPAAPGPKKPAVRPRNAASLVLLRQGPSGPEVLMGQRAAGHKFMPNRVVFPGGRVDAQDSRIPAAAELRPDVLGRLTRAASAPLARRLALAAVRETFEETGLMLGRPYAGKPPKRQLPEGWQGFFAQGLAPALDALDFFCRAVTPPTQPIRFNARFFTADAAAVTGELRSNGELHFLRWYSVEEALALDLARITRNVLEELVLLLREPPVPGPERKTPLYRTMGDTRARRLE